MSAKNDHCLPNILLQPSNVHGMHSVWPDLSICKAPAREPRPISKSLRTRAKHSLDHAADPFQFQLFQKAKNVDHAVTVNLVGRDVTTLNPSLYYSLIYTDPIGDFAPIHQNGPVQVFNAFG